MLLHAHEILLYQNGVEHIVPRIDRSVIDGDVTCQLVECTLVNQGSALLEMANLVSKIMRLYVDGVDSLAEKLVLALLIYMHAVEDRNASLETLVIDKLELHPQEQRTHRQLCELIENRHTDRRCQK